MADDELHVQRLGADGRPIGGVAVFGLVPGATALAVHLASQTEEAAAALARMGEGMRSLSMAVSNLDPELLRLLIGGKPRRGWKGHGAPRLWYPARTWRIGGTWLWWENPHGSPRARKRNRRVGW